MFYFIIFKVLKERERKDGGKREGVIRKIPRPGRIRRVLQE